MDHDFFDNRQIRIFISSTFRDMQNERDYLITKIFPSLRRYCETLGVSLFELDLRWGISEEEAKQGKVFEICLKEVIKTKPFFIGLLGERYGWIPAEEERKTMAENTAVFEDFPWVSEKLIEGTSITEIEIMEGVLRSKEKMNAYFYFRSPVIETPEEFREKIGSHEEQKLSKLKNNLRGQNVYPVKEYESIEELGAYVEKDFKALVNELFPQGSLTPFEKERLQQHNFFNSKTNVYVPDPRLNAALDEFANSVCAEIGKNAIVVTGASGMGKSALLANWIKRREEKQDNNEKIIFHFIGISQSEGDYRKISKRLADEARDLYNLPARDENSDLSSAEKSGKSIEEKDLQTVLFSIPEKEKLIIILDGIDRLDDTENAKLLNWILPYPSNVKMIFSALPDDRSMEAFERRGYDLLKIEALPQDSRKRIITEYLRSYSKALASPQVNRIASDEKTENPLILLSILDELRLFGVHEKLDERIEHYLAAPDCEGIFGLVLQRIEEVFADKKNQKNPAEDILSLISVSRNGLSEKEILDLSDTAPFYWSQLSNSIAGHLTITNGLVFFSNRMMLNAARKRYFGASSEKQYRSRVAAYMETNESFIRKCIELPYQLFEMEDWDRLCNFLLDYKVFIYLFKKDKYEIGMYWRVLKEKDAKRFSMEKYLTLNSDADENDVLIDFFDCASSLIVKNLFDYSLGLIFAEKYNELTKKLCGEKHPNTAKTYNIIGKCYEYMAGYNKAIEFYNKSLLIMEGSEDAILAQSYNNIGNCFHSLGNDEKSLEYHNKALAMREIVFGKEHPETAYSYTNIGICYYSIGNYEKSLEYDKKALAIKEKILGREHPDTATSNYNIGVCYRSMGNYEKSLEYYFNALAINEKILGKGHPNTALFYSSIGTCYDYLGNYEKSLEYYSKAMTIRETVLGKEHPDTARSYNNMGICFKTLGNYEKSLEYYDKALAVKEKTLGKEHPDTARSYNNIGSCFYSLGNFEKSIEYHKMALSVREKVLGKNHHFTASSYNNIGMACEALGEKEKALEYYNQAYSIYNSLKGKEADAENIRQSIERIKEIP